MQECQPLARLVFVCAFQLERPSGPGISVPKDTYRPSGAIRRSRLCFYPPQAQMCDQSWYALAAVFVNYCALRVTHRLTEEEKMIRDAARSFAEVAPPQILLSNNLCVCLNCLLCCTISSVFAKCMFLRISPTGAHIQNCLTVQSRLPSLRTHARADPQCIHGHIHVTFVN